MKYLIKDKLALHQFLSKAFWSRKRWAVCNASKTLSEKNVDCFFDFKDAVRFCEKQGGLKSDFKITVLSNLLRELIKERVKNKQVIIKNINFYELQQSNPLVCFSQKTDWQKAIKQRLFFPVTWNKIIHPLIDIKAYKIITDVQDCPSGCTNDISKVISLHDNFKDANNRFMELSTTLARKNQRNFLQLVGEIVFNGEQTSVAALPLKGSFIELYRFYYHSKRQAFLLQQTEDITSSILFPLIYFARYNHSKLKLEFYDTMLKKVYPGNVNPGIDLRYYLMAKEDNYIF